MSQTDTPTPENQESLNDQPLAVPVHSQPGTGTWTEDPSYTKEEPAVPVDALKEDTGAEHFHANATAAEVTAGMETEVENNDWKDKVSDTFHDLKDKAGDIAGDIKDKAEDVWEDLKSGKLKEEAEDKLDDLKDGAKHLWDKITGKKEQP